MDSNKSTPKKSKPGKKRVALVPQRSHGRLRVAALLDAGAAVIAEKGFQAATMAEIAARAGAPIGSLYRFFPGKEILADALVQRFGELINAAFGEVNSRVKSLSPSALTEAFLKILVDLHGEKPAIRALLEAHPGWSAKRAEFRRAIRRHVATTLTLRCPGLNSKTAGDMAVVILQNMKAVGVLNRELQGNALSGALSELHAMTRLYLADKLGD